MSYWPPGSPTDLDKRREWYVGRGLFLSPSEAPPRIDPDPDADRAMVGYKCSFHGTEVAWAAAEPRAFGYDRDWQPEDGWCPFCGREGELQQVESPEALLRRMAPELGT